MIVFDPEKDKVNIAKHGISLGRAADLDVFARVADDRFAEPRFRAYGMIGSVFFCLAYTIRDGHVRAIRLRRAHSKEIRRYGIYEDKAQKD